MKTPEKIYLYPYSTDGIYEVETKPLEGTVEYTRTDAFIENVCAFLKDRIEHDSIDYPMATMHLIEDLKQYIEKR